MICFVILAEAVVPDDWIKISFSVDNSSIPNFRDGYQRHRDGNTNSSGIERSIAFGYEAAKKQFPSMASLSIWGDYDWYHVCGAVLVSIGVRNLFYSVRCVGLYCYVCFRLTNQ